MEQGTPYYTQDGSSYALLVLRLFSDDEDDGRKTIAYWETTLNYHDIVENFRSAMHTTNENGSFYEKYSHDPPSSWPKCSRGRCSKKS